MISDPAVMYRNSSIGLYSPSSIDDSSTPARNPTIYLVDQYSIFMINWREAKRNISFNSSPSCFNFSGNSKAVHIGYMIKS